MSLCLVRIFDITSYQHKRPREKEKQADWLGREDNNGIIRKIIFRDRLHDETSKRYLKKMKSNLETIIIILEIKQVLEDKIETIFRKNSKHKIVYKREN